MVGRLKLVLYYDPIPILVLGNEITLKISRQKLPLRVGVK